MKPFPPSINLFRARVLAGPVEAHHLQCLLYSFYICSLIYASILVSLLSYLYHCHLVHFLFTPSVDILYYFHAYFLQ